MQPIPLNALRVFEAAARSDNFRAAAEELCVSQSAVSHQIKHLEEWFGTPLYDRTESRPRLLPHGEVLARALAFSLADIAAACRRARQDSGPQSLVIAAVPSVAICWLIPRLSGFRALHPEIAIRIIYAFHEHKVDFGDVDLAFVFSDVAPSRAGTRTHLFLPGISTPVCSPGVRDAMIGMSLPAGIAKAGFLHDSDIAGWEQWFLRAECSTVPSLEGTVFEDFNLLRAAALAGQGVALCPLSMVSDDLQAGRLVQLSEIAVNKRFGYYLIEHALCNAATTIAVDAFRTWLFDTRGYEPVAPVAQETQVIDRAIS